MRIPTHTRIPVATRIARLRKLVQTGTYEVNLEALAARIFVEEVIRTANN